MCNNKQKSIGSPVDEYKELCENMRHYGNMRFAQLTLFVAMNAGLLTAVFASNPPLSDVIRIIFKLGGAIVCVCFKIMEDRAADYWLHYNRRAIELEHTIGYKQYSTRKSRRLFTATNATQAIYVSFLILWLAALIWYRCI